MSYQPIYDGEFDLVICETDELFQFLESLSTHKLVLLNWVSCGPAGGNPAATIRGTRRQLLGWLNSYYDPEHSAVEPGNSDAETWANAQETFSFKFVA